MGDLEEKLVEDIFSSITDGAVARATRLSLRLSRLVHDHLSSVIFMRQLGHSIEEIAGALLDDMPNHADEARTFVFELGVKRWLASRKLPLAFGEENGEPLEYLDTSIGELDTYIKQLEASITDVIQKQDLETAEILRLRIGAVAAVQAKALNHCQAFASKTERQLRQQLNARAFLDQVQTDVLNYFAAHSPDVVKKLEKAEELLASSNQENFSLLLTQVRRTIAAIADHFIPPETRPVLCSDGVERKLGTEQYLNRLEEFVRTKFGQSTSGDLLKSEIDYFAAFMRRLNDLSSKGVHSVATHAEARQGLLGLYMFLFNLIGKLGESGLPATTTPGNS